MKKTALLLWLACFTAIRLHAQSVHEPDSLALVAIHQATDGPEWALTWDVPEPVKSWSGGAFSPDLNHEIAGRRYNRCKDGTLLTATHENRLIFTGPAPPDLALNSRKTSLRTVEATSDAIYVVRSESFACGATSAQIHIDATGFVSGVVGYLIDVEYPPERFTPTGTIDFSNSELIEVTSYAELFESSILEPGRARYIVVVSASSPADTRFNGTGELLTIDFDISLEAEIGEAHSISATVEESYLIGFEERPTETGIFTIAPQTQVRGAVSYMGAPMPYDPSVPERYNPTSIAGVDFECSPITSARTLDLNGEFIFDLVDAPQIALSRDASNATFTDIIRFINGADLVVMANIILDRLAPAQRTFPEYYKSDINGDRGIRPNDIFLLQKYIVGTLSEEEEAALAEAWTFADSVVLRSSAYDQFTVEAIPGLPECIALQPDLNACQTLNLSIVAFLRGDVNGSFDPATEGVGLRISDAEEVVIDWRSATAPIGQPLIRRVPVRFSAVEGEPIEALSFDAVGQFDPRLELVDIEYPNRQVAVSPTLTNSDYYPFYDTQEGNLRFTSFVTPDNRPLAADSTLLHLVFRMPLGTAVEEIDYGSFLSLINGETVETRIVSPVPEPDLIPDLEDGLMERFRLSPNPVSERLLVELPAHEGCKLTLFSAEARYVLAYDVPAQRESVTLNVSGLAQGLYVLQAETDKGTALRRFVIW